MSNAIVSRNDKDIVVEMGSDPHQGEQQQAGEGCRGREVNPSVARFFELVSLAL